MPRRRRIVRAFFIFWAACLAALMLLRAARPALDHGDPTTDSNILNAGENFDREGLASSWGIPAVDTYRDPRGQLRPDYYTTYPPGAYWFHQAAVKPILKALGVPPAPAPMPACRLASLAVFAWSILLLFALLRRVSGGDPLPAALACALYILSKPFVEYADNLHYISLSNFTLFAALYAWVRYEDADSPGPSLGWLCATALAFFIDSWLTFEHALFIPAFAAIRALWLRKWGRLIPAALLLAVPAAALAIRLCLNRAVLGSFSAAINVLRSKAEQRVGSSGQGTGLSGLLDAWLPRLGGHWLSSTRLPADHPDIEFALPFLSPWVLIPALILAITLLAALRNEALRGPRRVVITGLILLAGGLTWFGAMTEHAIVHRFTAMLILPGLATTAGGLAAIGLTPRRPAPAPDSIHPAPARPRASALRILSTLAALTLLAGWVWPLHSSFALNRAFPLDPTVRAAIARRDDALAAFARAGQSLTDVSRLIMYTYDAPAARALGRPFDNEPGRIPASLAPGEAVLIPLWWPESRRAAVTAATTLDLPEPLAPVLDPYLVFRHTDAAPPHPADLTTASGLTLRRLAWRPSLDRSAWVLTALVEGPLDRLHASGLTLALHTVQPDGTRRRAATVPIPAPDGLRAGQTALIVLAIPNDALTTAEQVRLSVHHPSRPRRAKWQPPGPAHPPDSPFTLTDDWVAWPHPPSPAPAASPPAPR